jgi:hypothetical protein
MFCLGKLIRSLEMFLNTVSFELNRKYWLAILSSFILKLSLNWTSASQRRRGVRFTYLKRPQETYQNTKTQIIFFYFFIQVTLPKSVVVVNGSGSHDDLKIVKYLWTRMPGSLAAGKILGSSNTESALLLVNLVPGLYIFQLQVSLFRLNIKQ